MAYAASIISGSIKYERVRDPFIANKFIKFMKSRDVVLSFSKTDILKVYQLIRFSDASFANLKCSGSQGGLIMFSEVSNGKYI